VLLDIQAGKSLTCEERPAREDEYGVLKVSAVSWGSFRSDENKTPPVDYEPPPEHEVKSGDLLISRANTTELVGAVVLVEQTRPRLLLSDKTLRLIPNEKVVQKAYLEIVLRQAKTREFIERNATGTSSSMKNISQETIRKIPISLPNMDIQYHISSYVTAKHKAITSALEIFQSQLDAINAMPAALLRRAFSGEL
jgi:type I restriction enzyme S subunit